MAEESVASKIVKLSTHFPCAGTDDVDFEIEMPSEISELSYQVLVQRIEFRRKCMNQGFDNLLELLKMHRDVVRKGEEIIKKTKEDNGKSE